ncbi:hypothetical protein Tco_1432116, partial [Tanacetum coccineum]
REMEKEDPSIVTKAFATDYDDYITKLSSEVNVEQVGTQPVDFMASGWKDPNIRGQLENTYFVLPVEAMAEVKNKFANSLVGFFVGKGVAFPLVQNYVTNTWAKFGFQKVMRDDDDFFYFKFSSLTGLEQVLEQGPWLIRNTPLILNKWTPDLSLNKDNVTKGRIVFARALVEVSADKELKHEVVLGVPLENGTGHKIERMRVEYEWKSPLCLDCHIFSHSNGQCPKRVLENVKEVPQTQEDGFTLVTKKKNKGKSIASNTGRKIEGVKFNKPKTNVMWSKKANQPVTNPKVADTNLATLKNKFLALQNDVPDVAESSKGVGDNTNRGSNMEDDESEVEKVFAEADPKLKGASTPSPVDRNV